jgi:hypothetical protein
LGCVAQLGSEGGLEAELVGSFGQRAQDEFAAVAGDGRR